jgi:predicted phage terminase large subunit-like protein
MSALLQSKQADEGSERLSAPAAFLAELLVLEVCRRAGAAADCRTDRRKDLLAWGRTYLPAYFRCTPSRMHAWLAEQLDRMTHQRGGKLNLLAPRGSAKSTVGALCYVLRSAVEGLEPYIWIISATKEQAAAHLDHIKAELEDNARLVRAYPRSAGRGGVWRSGAIELLNGAVVESYGAGQQLRGRRRREHRPSLIVCDDVQNDLLAASPRQRGACRQWFQGVVLKAGDKRTNVVNLATALHRDALAMNLHGAPGWTSALFRAVERWPDNLELWRQWEAIASDRGLTDPSAAARAFFDAHRAEMLAGGDVLWPEREDLYELMTMRLFEGRASFEREKQNSPIDPERCEWPEAYFEQHIWFEQWPPKLAVRTIALDPSKGADARHGDYSAYVLLGADADGMLYVEADLARRPTPQMVADGVALCMRFRPHALGIEAHQYHDLLAAEFAAEFRRRNARLTPPLAIHNHVNKQVRIRTLGPRLSQGLVRFRSHSASTQLLVDQLRDFPLGDHDDGPDALEMAVRLANHLLDGGSADDGLGDRLIF